MVKTCRRRQLLINYGFSTMRLTEIKRTFFIFTHALSWNAYVYHNYVLTREQLSRRAHLGEHVLGPVNVCYFTCEL